MESAGAVPGSTPGLSRFFCREMLPGAWGFSPPVLSSNAPRPSSGCRVFIPGGVRGFCKCILTVEDRFATWLTVTPCGEQASVRVGSTPALPMVLASVPPFHKERARPAIGTACAVFCQGCGTLRTKLCWVYPAEGSIPSQYAVSHVDDA